MKLTVYTDGASRGNPGHASYGFVIFSSKGEKIYSEGKYVGLNTNNFAEYSGVLYSFKYLAKLGKQNIEEVNFYMDSKLVVEQLSGRFKIKSQTLKPLIEEINKLRTKMGKITFTHIPREKNMLADSLANKALDSR